ncbi:metallophosphoesterase [Bacillus clarus]|uniref:Calcineurin-like phosphoesterase family protein n=1 Tax=Bacillus clarus TaxID=2338372 RepID=A0A090YTT0_9BACI|nr:metallophosphoesterase [Bacillus clarus]KFN01627.1 calcineurin-like phosphoesterase family protein [Bacillus clarus]RFT68787.1 metallophosphoesterase [Bacillus clarus]
MKQLSRRNFLKTGIRTCFYTFITAGIGYYYAKYVEPHFLSFTHHTLKSSLIPKSFHGMKIIQFSDLHLGYYFSLQHLSHVVSKINATRPDIVLFTGDLIDDYQTYSETPFVSSILRTIQAPFGKFAIYGNHDHGGYGTEYYKQIMYDSEFQLLQNKEKRIRLLDHSEISIFGIDDMLLGKPEIEATLRNAKQDIYTIVLVHEPDIAPKISEFPINLQLSGHSHGGQVQIPFLGPIITPVLAKYYTEGFYHIHDLLLYVNRGLGRTRVPFRFMARPEITIFTLHHS